MGTATAFVWDVVDVLTAFAVDLGGTVGTKACIFEACSASFDLIFGTFCTYVLVDTKE